MPGTYVAMVTTVAAILLLSYVNMQWQRQLCNPPHMPVTLCGRCANHGAHTCLSHFADDARITVRTRPTPTYVPRTERRYHVKSAFVGEKNFERYQNARYNNKHLKKLNTQQKCHVFMFYPGMSQVHISKRA